MWMRRELGLTWWHSRGYGGGGELALALGGHGSYLDGVGGEGSQTCDPVLLCQIG